MIRIILPALLLAVSLCASAQTYIPLQPAHAAVPWYQPGRSGEGLMLSLIPVDAGHVVFATIYLDEPHQWLTAQGDAVLQGQCPIVMPHCYRLDLYLQVSLGESWRFGDLWLSPGIDTMDWLLVIAGGFPAMVAREGTLYPLGPVSAGACGRVGFGPHPPLAADEWCDQ